MYQQLTSIAKSRVLPLEPNFGIPMPKCEHKKPKGDRLKKVEGDMGRTDALRGWVEELEAQTNTAASRLLSAPDDLVDLLNAKMSEMKRRLEMAKLELAEAETAGRPKDVSRKVAEIAERLSQLSVEIEHADSRTGAPSCADLAVFAENVGRHKTRLGQ